MTKQKRERYRCSFCGKTYPKEQQAAQCVDGTVCRRFNAPEPARREAFTLQVSLAYALHSVLNHLQLADPCAKDLAVRLEFLSQDITLLQCGPWLMQQVCSSMEAQLKKIWGTADNPSTVVLELHALIAQMCTCLAGWWQAHPNEKAPEIWQVIMERLVTLGGSESAELSMLLPVKKYLWPDSKMEQQLKLYLLGDRFWVAALNREQARSLIKENFGLINLSVKGIDLNEILEDGRTARDLLSLAQGRPCLLGRTE